MRHFYGFFLLISTVVTAQQKNTFALDVSVLRGNTIAHKEDMYHLINGHPQGLLLEFTVQTHGRKEWQTEYNYPDYGGYFMYQDFNSRPLGLTYSAGAFYNFYFWKRQLQLKFAQGVALTTHPYDKADNSTNKAFGTRILDNTNIGLAYSNQTVLYPIGFHAGLLFTHYSNGRVKSPNSGINTFLLNVGLQYNFTEEKPRAPQFDSTEVRKSYREPLHYNVVFRTGINESPIIRSGQKPFYHLGFYVDKRLNRKSGLQLGTDLFLTESFKEYIRYYAVAYPEEQLDPNTDYKRVGLFAGYELYINKLSLEAQVGYYVYQPFKKDIAIYDRVGMKYYITNQFFGAFTIKTHLFLAEALEFGVGYRF
ncbi:acyloxyacyl hydrolase [Flavobacterium sedimenticola]|uniref:Acyloxyacyl hydrolase n=1 Tax=Flavobacterium sedimenticola TaxID=3043286 RepID=A0ABT6XNM5_9FLAO|nr:acyloxyacyl hydrolase [Flavobacterium sedimenticola]MDI9256582.1 acyloxyacyl hydrolase [Flavobacterium sedimenticola]